MNKQLIAIDTETDGLDGRLLGVSYYDGINNEYLIYEKDPEGVLDFVKKAFESNTVIFHNAKYDMKQFERLGLAWPKEYHDTLLLAHLLEFPSLRLKDLAVQVLGVSKEEIQKIGREFDAKSLALTHTQDSFIKYAKNDSKWTYELFESLFAILSKDNKLVKAYEFELELIPVLAAMELRGMKIDVDFLMGLKEQVQKELEMYKGKLFKAVGRVFNPASPKQLLEIYHKELGSKIKSTNVKSLNLVLRGKTNKKAKDFTKDLLEYRKRAKIVSTYMDNLVAMLDSEGRLHGNFNQTGTNTGRLSSSSPNLQNMPAHDEWGYRKAFIASPGYKLIVIDYSQIELRVLAHFSKDPTMIEAFCSGEDLHSATAKKVFKLDCPVAEIKSKYPDLRQASKKVNFGISYGITAKGLSADLGISEREADKLIKDYFIHFPNVRRFIVAVQQYAKQFGYVRTLSGRKRSLDIRGDRGWMRKAVNTVIQGSAADIVKKAMVKLFKALKEAGNEAHLICQVHDEMMLEVPEDKVNHYFDLMKTIMETVTTLRVPLEVDGNIGNSWYDAK